MSEIHGIVLYDIELDECLNGVWTNQHNEGVICNEIAKRTNPSEKNNDDEIAGFYKSTYIEFDNNIHNGTLTIEPFEGGYSFLWKYENGNTFKGKGYRMNTRQIAVHYSMD
ncbi:MAG TPA: hypothetical protein VK808_08175 [Bacteroidia bacterium]|jgi:hypothetical protein|nr:hypothetical protein [Bacteroidia bacterium]